MVGPDGVVYAGGSPGGTVYRIDKGAAVPLYETHARYVWALAVAGGNLYVGTGLPGQIHRVSAAGKGERIHATPDAHVRTLCVDSRGRVWAGTSGSGLVLRIDPAGAVSTVYDSSKSEITAIAASGDGRIWAAAGSAGRLVRRGASRSPRPPPAPTATAVKSSARGGGREG